MVYTGEVLKFKRFVFETCMSGMSENRPLSNCICENLFSFSEKGWILQDIKF